MKITLNGEQQEMAVPTTISKLLAGMQLHPEAIVVEINGKIIDRSTFVAHLLCDGDRIEIIRFVGGG